MPITTKVVSSNPTHGQVYSIQHYVIKFIRELRQVGGWFSLGTSVSSTNKTDRYDKTEILLKVALNTIATINDKILLSTKFIGSENYDLVAFITKSRNRCAYLNCVHKNCNHDFKFVK